MTPLNIGIVGAGGIARTNATEAARSQAARVVGVYDVNHQVARDLARSLSVPLYSSYEDLLASREVEAVLISVPHHLHHPLTVQAALRGKHVLVEKPIARTVAEAEAMISACQANGVALTVNYSFRYLPRVQKAREIIRQGAVGAVTGVQILLHQYKDRGYWNGARSNSPDDWRASKEQSGGGFLIMNVCHLIDSVTYLTSLKPKAVYGEFATLASPAEVEDILSLSYRLENEAVGSISASSIMRGTEQAEIRIWGTHGTITLDGQGLSYYSTRPIEGRRPGKLHRMRDFREVSWIAEWVNGFARSVREGVEPDISARQACENLIFIETAYRSFEQGCVLQVPAPNAAIPSQGATRALKATDNAS